MNPGAMVLWFIILVMQVNMVLFRCNTRTKPWRSIHSCMSIFSPTSNWETVGLCEKKHFFLTLSMGTLPSSSISAPTELNMSPWSPLYRSLFILTTLDFPSFGFPVTNLSKVAHTLSRIQSKHKSELLSVNVTAQRFNNFFLKEKFFFNLISISSVYSLLFGNSSTFLCRKKKNISTGCCWILLFNVMNTPIHYVNSKLP